MLVTLQLTLSNGCSPFLLTAVIRISLRRGRKVGRRRRRRRNRRRRRRRRNRRRRNRRKRNRRRRRRRRKKRRRRKRRRKRRRRRRRKRRKKRRRMRRKGRNEILTSLGSKYALANRFSRCMYRSGCCCFSMIMGSV